jgi:hypothetical protein
VALRAFRSAAPPHFFANTPDGIIPECRPEKRIKRAEEIAPAVGLGETAPELWQSGSLFSSSHDSSFALCRCFAKATAVNCALR